MSLIPYGAVKLADRAASAEWPVSVITAMLAAAGQDPIHPDSSHPDAIALLLLLLTLDILAFLAITSLAFLLCAAIARAAAPRAAFPHPRLTGALRTAMAPLHVWGDACHVAADRVIGASTPRDAVLALALGACVAHSLVHFVGTMAPPAPHHGLPFHILDAHAYVGMLGALLFLAVMASRVTVPAWARLWREP